MKGENVWVVLPFRRAAAIYIAGVMNYGVIVYITFPPLGLYVARSYAELGRGLRI